MNELYENRNKSHNIQGYNINNNLYSIWCSG